MKLIKVAAMKGPQMPLMGFQFGVSVQAESLMIGNLDWEELSPMDPMGQPLPEWEAQQARDKGMIAERATTDPTTMIALLENMPASTENFAKAKGSAFDLAREMFVAALRVAEKDKEVTVDLVSFPLMTEESKSEFES